MNNLGKKNIWWKVRVFLLAPLWVLSTSPTRKTWKEFKMGLINHNCEWDYENKVIDKYGKHYPCKHFGCNIISMKEQNGKWTWDE